MKKLFKNIALALFVVWMSKYISTLGGELDNPLLILVGAYASFALYQLLDMEGDT